MKKLLIFYNEEELKPIGGPCGYLYNLNIGLKENTNSNFEIEFLHNGNQLKNLKKNVRKSKNSIIKNVFKIYKRIQHVKEILQIIYCCKYSSLDFNEYDAIHFHTTRDLYIYRKQLENYKGQIILTSHSPQPLYNEYLDGASKLELLILGKIYSKLIKMDEYAFSRADKIVFPCEFADEPYEKNWNKYKEIKNRKKSSYRYLLTGTVEANVKTSRTTIREKYHIPEDAFLISYVGRHNEIKGYDKLKNIGAKILEKTDNVYILVAGNIGPLQPLDHERWIEVGWTNDPHSIVAASDVFVLPNKETYFDLVLLEVLSIGTPAVITDTGGNKFFRQFANNGIFLYQSVDECEKIIYKIKSMEKEKREKMKLANRKIYLENFTTDIFAKNYISVIESIFSEETSNE